ncbi:MarR family protein [Mumia flava]|uniref:MarR family protein n=1 Tax=Mumia flava TaxID=1348852 RepID=A0A2M9B6A7_9ACTN|nr:MarR family transcriptional regulator [Mumia flava]PJJ53452.1 MarR family protein [Mumia flava]
MPHDLLEPYRLLIADVYELAGASRSTSETLARAERRTAAQWHVLSVLLDGSTTVPRIAARLGLSRQAVQRVVHDLRGDAQVDVTPNSRDARSPLVVLTPAGRETVDRLYERSAADRSLLLESAGVSRSDLERARATVQALVTAIRSVPPGAGAAPGRGSTGGRSSASSAEG